MMSTLEQLSKGINIVSIKPEKLNEARKSIIRQLAMTGKRGVYVTLGLPHFNISSAIDRKYAQKLVFVDGASSESPECKSSGFECVHVDAMRSLTDLSIVIEDLTSSGVFDFIIFDSISTALIYHDIDLTERFIHHVIERLRNHKMRGVLIIIEGKSIRDASSVFALVDNYIKL